LAAAPREQPQFHLPRWDRGAIGWAGTFKDSNILFGDGHVGTREVLENYVLRGFDDYLPY